MSDEKPSEPIHWANWWKGFGWGWILGVIVGVAMALHQFKKKEAEYQTRIDSLTRFKTPYVNTQP